jgi:iron complex outermembrane receptor protein
MTKKVAPFNKKTGYYRMTRFFTIIVLIVLLSYGQLVARNVEKDTTVVLNEVVITYQANKLTPVNFQNISQTSLKTKSVGQEPSFILSETPSITVYSDAGNTQGYSYYRLRGIDQTRINMTFDGVPMNEPEDQGAYFSNYPDLLNSVDKIQIQRGVGTSKNGSANYAGSIQLFSPNLRDSTKTTFGLGYGSFNSLRAFTEYKSGLKNRKAVYVRASEVFSQGYKYHSSNHSQSIFASGGLFYDKSVWKVNLLAGHQQNDMAWLGVSDSLINLDRRTNANTKPEKDRFFQTMAQVHNTWLPNSKITVQSAVFYTFLDGNYDFDLNNYLGLPLTDELYNYDFQSHWSGFYSNFNYSTKNLKATSGIQGNLYQRRHLGSEKTLGKLYENKGFKNEASIFAKLEYFLKRLHFFADIQYRYASFDTGQPHQN